MCLLLTVVDPLACSLGLGLGLNLGLNLGLGLGLVSALVACFLLGAEEIMFLLYFFNALI